MVVYGELTHVTYFQMQTKNFKHPIFQSTVCRQSPPLEIHQSEADPANLILSTVANVTSTVNCTWHWTGMTGYVLFFLKVDDVVVCCCSKLSLPLSPPRNQSAQTLLRKPLHDALGPLSRRCSRQSAPPCPLPTPPPSPAPTHRQVTLTFHFLFLQHPTSQPKIGWQGGGVWKMLTTEGRD